MKRVLRGAEHPQYRHGLAHTPLGDIWQSMLQRCTNPRNHAYPDYGGRGITVCERWRADVEAFAQDMGPRPSPTHTLDRIDNDGNYEPDNCRWATRKEQAQNRRDTRRLTFQGRTMCLVEWARELGVSEMSLWLRIYRRGWSVERALTTPSIEHGAARRERLARAAAHGVSRHLLRYRLEAGWDLERAMTEGPRPRRQA